MPNFYQNCTKNKLIDEVSAANAHFKNVKPSISSSLTQTLTKLVNFGRNGFFFFFHVSHEILAAWQNSFSHNTYNSKECIPGAFHDDTINLLFLHQLWYLYHYFWCERRTKHDTKRLLYNVCWNPAKIAHWKREIATIPLLY